MRTLQKNSVSLSGPKKYAFTLIELIIVITIIGLLVGFLVVDYRAAIRKQELKVTADVVVAMMQQTRAEVVSGKKTDGKDGALLLCEGVYFEIGNEPMKAVTYYDVEKKECVFNEIAEEQYGINAKNVSVASIVVGGSSFDLVWALFEPPGGQVAFFDSSGVRLSNDAQVYLEHDADEDLQVLFEVSANSNQFTLINPEESEE